MSWQATTWVIEHSKHKGSALLTLIMIANCANEKGEHAFPSFQRLAMDTRMSPRQVSRIVDQLEKSGELGVNRSGGRTSHNYSLPLMNPDKLSTLARPNIDKMSTLNSDKMSRLSDSNNDKLSGLKECNVDISSSNMDIAMSTDQSLDQSSLLSNKKKDEIDPPFRGTEFLQALADFEEHRKELRHKLTPLARKKLFAQLLTWGEAKATRALNLSVQNGWRGVFEPDGRNGNEKSPNTNTQNAGRDLGGGQKYDPWTSSRAKRI